MSIEAIVSWPFMYIERNSTLNFKYDKDCQKNSLYHIAVEWAPLDDSFDKCSIGSGDDIRFYNVLKGRGNEWKNHLKKQGIDSQDFCAL